MNNLFENLQAMHENDTDSFRPNDLEYYLSAYNSISNLGKTNSEMYALLEKLEQYIEECASTIPQNGKVGTGATAENYPTFKSVLIGYLKNDPLVDLAANYISDYYDKFESVFEDLEQYEIEIEDVIKAVAAKLLKKRNSENKLQNEVIKESKENNIKTEITNNAKTFANKVTTLHSVMDDSELHEFLQNISSYYDVDYEDEVYPSDVNGWLSMPINDYSLDNKDDVDELNDINTDIKSFIDKANKKINELIDDTKQRLDILQKSLK